MPTQTIHQETVVLPASWFQKIQYTQIAGVDVIIGHWELELGSQTYPMSQVICTLYHATIVHPSEKITEIEDSSGDITISSLEGINIKVSQYHGFCVVQIWE